MSARLLVVFPTVWDARQLQACEPAWRDRFEIRHAEPEDARCAWNFDVLGFVEQAATGALGPFDAVFSSSDYPGATAAAAIATRLGLPGPRPERVLAASHKYRSRLVQREAAPDATPGFCLVDPERPRIEGLSWPCFLKPVKGAFSIRSGRIDSEEELAAFFARPATREFLDYYVWMFDRLVDAFTDFGVGGRAFVAEEYLRGRQATVEGWAYGDEIHVLGIVDSTFHENAPSFARFDLPSSLPAAIRERMADIALRVVSALGLRDTLFNLEMNWNPATDDVHVIEVNPRMAGQFADLYEKVLGTSSYEIGLALAAGVRPDVRPGPGPFSHAASFPLRVFHPCRVTSAPAAERIAEVEARIPGARVWSECAAGDTLSDFAAEDGHSMRYAVVNVGAASRAGLARTLQEVKRALGFELAPL
ncbi:MAG: ATP-grasp domain-containing protein [Gemmatimonadota bacterium]